MVKASRVHLQGWGEPFLNPYLMDFVSLARKAGCSVSTTTCGMLINESQAERIVSSGMDIIAFSLAGTDDDSNGSRDGIPFSRVEQSVQTLQKIRRKKNAVHLEIHLAYLMLASNIEAVQKLPQLMEEWGVHAAVVSTMDYIPSAEMEKEAFAPHEREKIDYARRILEKVAKKIRSSGRDFYASLPAPSPASSCRERTHKTMYVDAEGQISPCVYLNVPFTYEQKNRTVFGLTANDNPLDIWKKKEYALFRSAVQSSIPPKACASCAKRYEEPCAQ